MGQQEKLACQVEEEAAAAAAEVLLGIQGLSQVLKDLTQAAAVVEAVEAEDR